MVDGDRNIGQGKGGDLPGNLVPYDSWYLGLALGLGISSKFFFSKKMPEYKLYGSEKLVLLGRDNLVSAFIVVLQAQVFGCACLELKWATVSGNQKSICFTKVWKSVSQNETKVINFKFQITKCWQNSCRVIFVQTFFFTY